MSDGRENLIPMSERSKDEARELGRKGGKASGKSRRQRATLKEAANAVLSAPIKDKALKAELKAAGVEEMNANSLFVLRLYQQAIDGDVQAARLFAQLSSEADPAALELARAKIDLEFLRLETVHLPAEPESDNSIIEALRASADEVWNDYEHNDQQEGNDDV